MGDGGIKVYQLVAYGYLSVRHEQYKMYSHKIYRTDSAARDAINEFSKLVTTPKNESDIMVMDTEGLRIQIQPLRLMNNKKEKKE